MTNNPQKMLLSISTYEYLAKDLVACGGYEIGAVERKTFPDGERYLRVIDDPRGRDVVLLGGTPSDLDWLELFDLGCAVSHAGARTLTMVMPYFGYSTMERATREGEVVTAKNRARLISAIPPCEGGTQVLLFDLHTAGTEFYFGDGPSTHHISGAKLIAEIATALSAGQPYVLGATDAGRAKWVEGLARTLGCEPAFVYKSRDAQSGELAITGVNADVSGRQVIIYDDMIRTGSSLLQAARAYREGGATEVHAIASHLVLPGDAAARLYDSGLLSSINGTNSHPRSAEISSLGGRVVSVCDLLARAIARH